MERTLIIDIAILRFAFRQMFALKVEIEHYTRRKQCYLTDNTKSSHTDDSSVKRVFALVSSNTERPTANRFSVQCFRFKQNGHKASVCRRIFEVT